VHADAGPATGPPAQLAAQEEVGDRVEVVAEREVLPHDRDALLLHLCGRGTEGPATDVDRARIRFDGAGDALHERRLPGAVLADEGDQLLIADAEIDAVEHLEVPVALP
jgi:hypothetical protein